MKYIDLAIIIPTLNEEYFIGNLLDSIAAQSVQPREIVVVDAYSKDGTIAQLQDRQKILAQLRFYQIPRKTIACQRNFGVTKVVSANLLFLDADTLLQDPQTLEKYLSEVKRKNPDLAAAPILPLSSYWKDRVYFKGINLAHKLAKPIWPIALGINIYFKKKSFKQVGGFDEGIAVGEDYELVQRSVKKCYKFALLKQPRIYTSVRRMEKEGRRKFTFKMMRSLVNVLLYGYKNNPIEYEFGKFKPKELN